LLIADIQADGPIQKSCRNFSPIEKKYDIAVLTNEPEEYLRYGSEQ